MADDPLYSIFRLLGEMKAQQDGLRDDFDEEKEATRESRRRQWQKLEKIEVDVSIVGQVAAQARDKADKVESIVVKDVKPVTDEVKRLRLLGMGAIAVVGFAAAMLGVTMKDVVGNVIQTIRGWAGL